MTMSRRLLLAFSIAFAVPACGGPSSRLITVRAGSGGGEVELEVKNASDVPVNALFLAKTETVDAADPHHVDGDSPEAQAIWGPDLLTTSAIAPGSRMPIQVREPGRWNARAVARDGREQHVAGLRLAGGGHYILELNDAGWRMP